jgi:hypothetical protein
VIIYFKYIDWVILECLAVLAEVISNKLKLTQLQELINYDK